VNFVDQPYASAFFLLVNQHSGLGFCDKAHGSLQLLAAIAALGREDVTR
jgi:hypothetical protein